MCAVLEFPVSSYYSARKREAEPSLREARDAILKEKIMEVWKGEKGREVYGARKVWLELGRQGTAVARCTVERLMRELAAPRGAVSYNPCSGWELEEVFSDLMALPGAER